jgi:hypothetical protein
MKNLLTLIFFAFAIDSFAVSKEHLDQYTDCLGRTTLLPSNIPNCLNKDYDSNNAILWSGEMAILLKDFHGEVPEDVKNQLKKFLPSHFVKTGLLSRHPEPYRYLDTMRPISFDEYTGVAFMASVIPELSKFMDDTVEYGIKNNWQFWDVPTYENGKSLKTLFSLKALKQWVPYLQEESLRKSTIKYPELYPLFATHHIHQQAFYKMMSSKYKPSLFEELYFAVASYFAEDKHSWSSLNMWIFRYKAIEYKKYDSKIISYMKERFEKKMLKRFGMFYETLVFQQFYEDYNHPFHLISKINLSKKNGLVRTDVNQSPNQVTMPRRVFNKNKISF